MRAAHWPPGHRAKNNRRLDRLVVDLIKIDEHPAFEIRLLTETACPQNRARGSSWVLITSIRLQSQ
jgi:hypothetical protein